MNDPEFKVGDLVTFHPNRFANDGYTDKERAHMARYIGVVVQVEMWVSACAWAAKVIWSRQEAEQLGRNGWWEFSSLARAARK